MSAEYAAEIFADAIAGIEGAMVGCVDEDVRSGGAFFDLTLKGRTYEVLVTETKGGAA